MNRDDLHVTMPSGADHRQATIAEMLRRRDFISVEELANLFSVATQTIRRDLVTMCELGLGRRRHGGIASVDQARNLAFKDRNVLNQAAKEQIALAVAGHVHDGESLSLGIGTTPQFVASALLSHRNLSIVTNNLSLALTLAQGSDFAVAIAGGSVRGSDLDVCGMSVDAFFATYKVDVAIFGVAGVDEDGSLLDFSEEEVRVRQAMQRNCRRSFLVLDSSKFTRPAFVRGGRIDEVTAVFCETDPPPRIARMLETSGVRFVRCPGAI